MFDGELYATPRAALPHVRAASLLLSASTEALDRGKKLRICTQQGVGHGWLMDPLRRRLEVLSLEV